jgi:hypothetical protein
MKLFRKGSKYFIGKKDTLEPKILAIPSTLMTLPMGTNSDLARLILKPKTPSKDKTNNASYEDDLDFPCKK